METVLRQFPVAENPDELTTVSAEKHFGVEVRVLDLEFCRGIAIRPSYLISVEGEHDNVYRAFDYFCPGVLTEQQRARLNG
ncbi:MAG: hypothetical protein AAB375_00600 [Patescibacteria group bacterium]